MGIGVQEAAPSDADSMENQNLSEQVQAPRAITGGPGKPEGLGEIPIASGITVFRPAFPLLENGHPIAFFRKPQSGNRTAETRTNDDDVVIEMLRLIVSMTVHSLSLA